MTQDEVGRAAATEPADRDRGLTAAGAARDRTDNGPGYRGEASGAARPPGVLAARGPGRTLGDGPRPCGDLPAAAGGGRTTPRGDDAGGGHARPAVSVRARTSRAGADGRGCRGLRRRR